MDASLRTSTPTFSTQPVQIRVDSFAYTENVAKDDIVDKKYCFRMMVWLCAYYDFFDKKVHWSCSQ